MRDLSVQVTEVDPLVKVTMTVGGPTRTGSPTDQPAAGTACVRLTPVAHTW